MIGAQYWTVGVNVQLAGCVTRPLWRVSLDYLDDGWCEDASTEGTLRVRYSVPDLAAALDVLIADAQRLGITFRDGALRPALYCESDDGDPWPASALDAVRAEGARLGWKVFAP